MKLNKKADESTGLEFRLESEDGRIEMGVYPVMFGARIRAGFAGTGYCEWDWCMGDNRAMVTIFYHLVKKYLETFEPGENPFAGLPGHSRVKPVWNDDEFMEIVIEKLNNRINEEKNSGVLAARDKQAETGNGLCED